jgi:hypothetical protein
MGAGMNWQRMNTYMLGTRALFWVDDGIMRYMVFGVLEVRGADGVLRVWDDNDCGYASAADVRAWAPCSPPRGLLH